MSEAAHIVVVDDDQDVRETVAEYLRRNGFSVTEADGGSSLRDYVQANGELGLFQHRFSVYDREGKRCPRGDGTVRRIVQSGRSTFFCPACQR